MTDETMNTEKSHVAADCPNERLVIFRCGWCGWPCNEDGSCMEMDIDEADEYLEEHKNSETECVNGHCCPNGEWS